MATPVHALRLSRDYRHIQKSAIPYIQTHPRPDNILIWPYVITGPPETPYSGGQYYGTLMFPENFPFAAPSIRMLTPSGRFYPNNVICTTFTNLHPEEWNPAWTVETILVGFLSFMTSEDMGAGTIYKGNTTRQEHAEGSAKWNSLHCTAFVKDFPEIHSANIANGTFTKEDMKLLEASEELWNNRTSIGDRPTEHDQVRKDVDSPFEPLSYEAHIKEDWEKFGSMEEEEDFDYYEDDSEQEEECETSETEIDQE